MYLHTIPRPPSIDDNVDGDKKSPARMTADGLGYNLAKKVCNRTRYVSPRLLRKGQISDPDHDIAGADRVQTPRMKVLSHL